MSVGRHTQKPKPSDLGAVTGAALVLGRDHNAARNILHRGLQTLRE